jgi:hypothetical protein
MDIEQMDSPETDTHYYSLNQLNEGASLIRFAMRKLSHLPGMDRELLGECLDTLEELRASISVMVMDVLRTEEESQRRNRTRRRKTITLPQGNASR